MSSQGMDGLTGSAKIAAKVLRWFVVHGRKWYYFLVTSQDGQHKARQCFGEGGMSVDRPYGLGKARRQRSSRWPYLVFVAVLAVLAMSIATSAWPPCMVSSPPWELLWPRPSEFLGMPLEDFRLARAACGPAGSRPEVIGHRPGHLPLPQLLVLGCGLAACA